MRLFLAGTSLQPAYGGPAYSVSRLALALTSAGVEVGLWAPDQSVADAPFLPAGSSVQRLTGSEIEALERFGHVDVLHDNGIWWPHNHRMAKLAAARGIPRVVSTRGMLEPWAIRHKRVRKALAWRLYQRRDLKRASCHHTTAEAEAQHLQSLGLGVPIRVIPNGVDLPALEPSPATGRERIALFLGRLYPVKGLPMLIDAWARVRPNGWLLKIVGPDEAGHRAKLERAAAATGLQRAVSFGGSVGGETKRRALLDADLVVLPSHSESFGMVIAEALAHERPVLTTTAAPWPMLVERGCGWRVDPTVAGLAEGLRAATAVDRSTLRAMGARGRDLVAAEFAWDRIAKCFAAIYEDVLVRVNA